MSSENDDAWIARSAAALCEASRWICVTSIALAVAAALAGWLRAPEPVVARAALSLIVAGGAAQAYLAVRIGFDQRIFAGLESAPQAVAAFDAALRALAWSGAATNRSLGERAAGLVRLVRRAGGVLVAQAILAIVEPWVA